jgi:hypothetical protein
MSQEPEILPLEATGTEVMAVVTRRPAPVKTPADTSPMGLLAMALKQGAPLETLEKFMDLSDRFEKNEARKAYNQAFAAFKSEAVRIIKNISVTDGPLKGKKYADLFAVVDSATPALSRNGLSHSWKLTKDEKDWLEVTCTLSHELGHSETVSMGGPPDSGGAKNAIQARASSVSYLERYTFLAITGLASSDQDTDGRTPKEKDMAEDIFQAHIKALNTAQTMEDLQKAFTVAYSATKDQDTKKALLAAKDIRKADLSKGGSK